jgi:hypothetical protein
MSLDARTSLFWIRNEIEYQTAADHIKALCRCFGVWAKEKILLEDIWVLRVQIYRIVIDPFGAASIIAGSESPDLEKTEQSADTRPKFTLSYRKRSSLLSYPRSRSHAINTFALSPPLSKDCPYLLASWYVSSPPKSLIPALTSSSSLRSSSLSF